MSNKKILATILSVITLLSAFGPIGYNLNAKAPQALSDTQFEKVKTIKNPRDIIQVYKQVKNFVKKLKENSNGSLSDRIIIKRMEMIEERLQLVTSGVQSAIKSGDNARLLLEVEEFSRLWAGASNYFQYFSTGHLDDTSGDGTEEEGQAMKLRNDNPEEYRRVCAEVKEIASKLFYPEGGIAKALGDAYQYCESVRAEITRFGFSTSKQDFKFLNTTAPIYSKLSLQKIRALLKSLKFHCSDVLISIAEKEVNMYIYVFISNMYKAMESNDPADMLRSTIAYCNLFIHLTNSSSIKDRSDVASVREFAARILYKALNDRANLGINE